MGLLLSTGTQSVEAQVPSHPEEAGLLQEVLNRGRPGLIATWSDDTQTVVWGEGRPAFRLRADEAPHPQISPQQFQGRWRGTLFIRRPGTYRFFGKVLGKLTLTINGQTILTADSNSSEQPITTESDPVDLGFGSVPFEATFQKERPGPCELRLFWQYEDEFRQPLNPTVLFHEANHESPKFQNWAAVERGRRLVGEFHCTACHTADERSLKQSALRPLGAPRLDNVGSRVYRSWLYHWLKDPHAFRPNTPMPRLFGNTETDRIDLYATTEYLSALGEEPRSSIKPRPAVEPDGGDERETQDPGREAFARTGCIACHRALGESGNDEIPELRSMVGLGSKTTPEYLRRYLLNPWDHQRTGRMPDFRFDQQDSALLDAIVAFLSSDRTPGFEKPPDGPSQKAAVKRFEAVIADAQQRAAFRSLDPSEQWQTLGREVVRRRGCLNCHEVSESRVESPASRAANEPKQSGDEGTLESALPKPPPLSALAGPEKRTKTKRGCLAQRPQPAVPDFELTQKERHALRRFLAQGTTGPGSDAPTYWAERNLREFGCTACHDRNGHTSTFAQRILDFVELGSDQQLQDITPPALTAVGEKLRPEWIHAVVVEGRRARPWMDLKMPAFPDELVNDLPRQLVVADGLEVGSPFSGGASPRTPAKSSPLNGKPDDLPESVTEEQLEAGRLLVGKTGFNCVSCHDIRGLESTGVRGPDLAGVTKRVRRDWFDRWLLDPQQINPGTRMPSVFFGGKSAAPQFLNGDPQAQRNALWAYLSQGDRLTLPPLDFPPTQFLDDGENPKIVPQERPVLVRGYMNEHGGNRGIALGFPQGTHFAFNSETCQLVTAWQGEFIEMSGWFGRGRGGAQGDFNKVLGDVFWRGPQRPFISSRDLPGLREAEDVHYTACWARTGDAGFTYRVRLSPDKWITVEDRPAPLPKDTVSGFRRSVTLKNAPPDNPIHLCVADDLDSDPRALIDLPSPSGRGAGGEGNRNDDEPQGVNGLLSNESSWIQFRRQRRRWAATVLHGSDGLHWTTADGELSLRFPPRSDKQPLHCTLVLVRLTHEAPSPKDLKSMMQRIDNILERELDTP